MSFEHNCKYCKQTYDTAMFWHCPSNACVARREEANDIALAQEALEHQILNDHLGG